MSVDTGHQLAWRMIPNIRPAVQMRKVETKAHRMVIPRRMWQVERREANRHAEQTWKNTTIRTIRSDQWYTEC